MNIENEARLSQISINLGEHLTRHRPVLAVCAIRLVRGLILCAIGFFAFSLANLVPPNWQYIIIGIFTFGPLVVLSLFYGIANLIETISGYSTIVDLYRDGIVFQRWNSRLACRWESIDYMMRRNLSGRRSSLIGSLMPAFAGIEIGLRDRKIFLNSVLSDFCVVYRTVEEQIERRLLPGAIKAYSSGETLVFGVIAVNNDRISREQLRVPWNQVSSLLIDDYLTVRTTDPHPTFLICAKATNIPNISVLLRLLKTTGVCRIDDRSV